MSTRGLHSLVFGILKINEYAQFILDCESMLPRWPCERQDNLAGRTHSLLFISQLSCIHASLDAQCGARWSTCTIHRLDWPRRRYSQSGHRYWNCNIKGPCPCLRSEARQGTDRKRGRSVASCPSTYRKINGAWRDCAGSYHLEIHEVDTIRAWGRSSYFLLCGDLFGTNFTVSFSCRTAMVPWYLGCPIWNSSSVGSFSSIVSVQIIEPQWYSLDISYLTGFAAMLIGNLSMFTLANVYFFYRSIGASRTIHDKLIKSVFGSTFRSVLNVLSCGCGNQLWTFITCLGGWIRPLLQGF